MPALVVAVRDVVVVRVFRFSHNDLENFSVRDEVLEGCVPRLLRQLPTAVDQDRFIAAN